MSEHEVSTAVSIDLLLDQQDTGPHLVPVERDGDGTQAVAEAALVALLDGPTLAEAALASALSSSIPDGATLNDVTLDDGLATVDVSAGFEAGGGSFAMLARLSQLVFRAFPAKHDLDTQIVPGYPSDGGWEIDHVPDATFELAQEAEFMHPPHDSDTARATP